jgi:uncharacterized membrane protein
VISGWVLSATFYLLPSVIFGLVIKSFSQRAYLFALMVLVGTIIHEVLHLVFGLLTFARPVSMSIIPVRTAGGYTLGSVSFTNIRWYNAAIVGLAPLLSVPLAIYLAYYRTSNGWSVQWIDFAI